MEIVVVSLAAMIASGLTLFSGFGLGTLLMPVVAIFFPLELAIALTAIVHLANNLFKIVLLGRKADGRIVLRFGLPAIAAAFIGAFLLTWLSGIRPILEYQALGRVLEISLLKLVVGLLIALFVVLELTPRFSRAALGSRYMPLGGVISGFFGGLSGHQGAFRSMFLLKAGLSKEAFVATGVVIAVLVDLSRTVIYGLDLFMHHKLSNWPLVAAASLSAFAGAYLGSYFLKKVTIRSIQIIVSVLLILVSLGLISGVL